MDKLQEIFSIYSVLVLLGIGIYMGFRQSKSLSEAGHLDKEAKFSKVIGYLYIAIGIVGGMILLI